MPFKISLGHKLSKRQKDESYYNDAHERYHI